MAIRIQGTVNDADCDSYLDALGSDVILVYTPNTLGELACPALLSQVTALAADITTFGCGRRWLGDGRPNLPPVVDPILQSTTPGYVPLAQAREEAGTIIQLRVV